MFLVERRTKDRIKALKRIRALLLLALNFLAKL